MSDPKTIDESERLKPLKQRRFSKLSLALQLFLITVILIAVNYLSCARYERTDLSENQRFTLSDRSISYINSDVVSKREKPIQITVAFRRNTTNYDRIRDLVEEYQDRSSKIEITFIDPLRNPNEALKLQNKYQLSFDENQILVDARPDPSADPEVDINSEKLSANAQIKRLSEENLIVYENDENGSPVAVALRVEDALTAAIVAAVEGNPRVVYLISDKSNLGSTSGEDAPYWRLFNALRLQNVLLAPLKLSGIEKIPDNAEAIAFIGPQYDLEPKEIEVLENYWKRPKSGILMMLDPNAEPKALHRFLRENGVSPRSDRILRVINERPVFDVTAVFTQGTPFTQDFWATSTIFEGQSRSLEVREGDSRLAARQIRAVPLIESTKGYYGETRFIEGEPTFNPNEDNGGTLALAAAIERGNAADVDLADNTSRMMIIGNTEFLMPNKLRSEQLDFVTSSVNWMLDREELAGIGARQTLLFKVSIDKPTSTAINAITLGLLPLLSVIIALIIWNVRRR